MTFELRGMAIEKRRARLADRTPSMRREAGITILSFSFKSLNKSKPLNLSESCRNRPGIREARKIYR